ncbi:MAG: CotH kinase family protein [Bacteroidetes bacterium]|nr:CotH kinase family protein [Bacteroidota bacterium]
MKKILWLFFMCLPMAIQAQLTSSTLPIIVINTNGQTIVDDPKKICDMGIIYNGVGQTNYLTDPFNHYFGKIAIEIRGSTSQQYPKKSYGLETQDSIGENANVSLLGMPKDNDWILYGAYPDKTLMRNEFTYSSFANMQPWSPRYVYCELVINNQYVGVYTLLEKIKIDDTRVDIANLDIDDNAGDSLTGGYIIKIDKTTGGSPNQWTSAFQSKVKFLYHAPKYAKLTVPQRNYIKAYVDTFEKRVYGPNFQHPTWGYAPLINALSFVDFFLMEEFGRTVDGYRSSSFMYKDKDSKGGKLTCGPMWDFNLSYANADYCDAYDTTGWQYNFNAICPGYSILVPDWWNRLLQDSNYTSLLKCRWNQLRAGQFSDININHWVDSVAAVLNVPQQRNFQKWPILGTYVNWNYYIGLTYADELNFFKKWMKDRAKWMDSHLPGTCLAPLQITDIANEQLDITIAPNPMSTHTVISFYGNNLTGSKKLYVFDMTGRLVRQQETSSISGFVFERNQLPAGIYIVKIVTENHQYATQKISLE